MCRKCLYCYQPLLEGEVDYHARCSQKIFGTKTAPLLPYKRSELEELAGQVIRSQTTLTGVQPKLSIDFDNKSRAPQRFTIVGLWGRFILKPQTEYYSHLPELEDLVMHLAELARIETVPHALIRFSDGELCYITRRIDRTPKGEKLPMEDMCQLSERLTEDKYKGSHERIARLILQYSSVPRLDLVKYWEQVIFAWIVGNADMHLKNYSLYAPDDRNYVLTPAYDLLSTAIVLPQDTEELALTLCGKKRKLGRTHFAEAMTQTGVDEKVCCNIIAKFHKALPTWTAFIKQSFLPVDMQEELIALIEKRMEEAGN
ncbi:MAG: HipA domain-containing protein [Bacteroidales bacterium]|nr:HipA domain-containing protein [Bacteroidales bacterium]